MLGEKAFEEFKKQIVFDKDEPQHEQSDVDRLLQEQLDRLFEEALTSLDRETDTECRSNVAEPEISTNINTGEQYEELQNEARPKFRSKRNLDSNGNRCRANGKYFENRKRLKRTLNERKSTG